MNPENDNLGECQVYKPADEIMCACSGTTRGKIYDLVMQGKDFEAISQWTGVNTGCSGCEWDIQAFVNALMEVKSTK